MDTHKLQPHDGEGDSMEINVQFADDYVSVKESANGDEYREALIEHADGVFLVRVYARDSDTPIIVRVPADGGIEIDRSDYDNSKGKT